MKTIVAAVDASEKSRLIFRESLVLASSIRADVVVLSVTPQYEGNMNRFCMENTEELLSEPSRKILKESFDYAESLGLNLQTVHRTGKASGEILTVAQEKGASMIVLGCARRHQLERMLLGRTTAEIIAESPCDVLLLPDNSNIRLANILVGIDDCPSGVEAQHRALDIARSYGGKVTGLYSIDLPTERALRYGVARDAESKAARILKTFTDRATEFGISVATTMSWNTPEKGLVTYGESHGTDMIVVGASEKPHLLELLGGSIIERLASLTFCPVLIAKSKTPGRHKKAGQCAFVFEE